VIGSVARRGFQTTRLSVAHARAMEDDDPLPGVGSSE
jgi:hypothetical protein